MAEAVNNRMMVIEDKANQLQEGTCTLDMALSMQDVANNLESLQADMGRVENFEAVMDKMRLLDQDLEDMDMKIEEMTDDIDYKDYLDELDEMEKKEAKDRLADMPEVPASAPTPKKVEMKKIKKVAAME